MSFHQIMKLKKSKTQMSTNSKQLKIRIKHYMMFNIILLLKKMVIMNTQVKVRHWLQWIAKSMTEISFII